MNANMGAPALPELIAVDHAGDTYSGTPGMSLKAYYAAKIMQGFCANPAVFAPNPRCGWDLVNMDPNQLASYVDVVASALLEQVSA